ncbi:MAG: tRNA (N6-isopentenyl adenosine(37)-C2)-methylthiotransferase MiaB [Pseudomonadota bacterium]
MSAITERTKPEQKKVFIKTWGCQMNVYDSVRMGDALEADGYVPTQDPADADLVLFNTCHIRERAADKVYSTLGRMRKLKVARADTDRPLMIGVTGCVAQAEGEEIIAREKAVDLVVGPQTYHRLGEVVRAAKTKPQVVTDYAVEDKFEHMPLATKRQVAARGVTAFLTVQEGCDKFCTFCVVPYTRGAEVSRPRAQILTEARSLADAGIREITLLGQNVNAWHGESRDGSAMGLGHLLHELASVPGIARLRYVTSHPRDMSDDLIDAHRDLDTLMPYLHLPVQSGSDRILKAMNRRHTARDYVDIINRVRDVRPDMAISGDFIVGFPGESDADFEDTLAIVRATKYASCFSFKYSRRPGTPGADMDGQVPEEVKTERLARLQALLNEQQLAFNADCIGKDVDLLLEKPGRFDGQLIGRSPWLQSVIVPSSAGAIGDIVPVTLEQAHANSLTATPRTKDAA